MDATTIANPSEFVEKKAGTVFRFEELPDEKVRISFVNDGNGSAPYTFTLTETTWGMLEDIMAIQETAGQGDSKPIFAFLNTYIEGGARAIPLRHTFNLFRAISEYLKQALAEQKNE